MNWNVVSAVTELLGVVGLLATLVYLAIQIRKQIQQMRCEAYSSLAESTRGLWAELRGNPNLLELLLRGNKDWNSLSPEEQCQYHIWNADEAQLMETAFVMWQEQAITESAYLEREQYYLSLLLPCTRLSFSRLVSIIKGVRIMTLVTGDITT